MPTKVPAPANPYQVSLPNQFYENDPGKDIRIRPAIASPSMQTEGITQPIKEEEYIESNSVEGLAEPGSSSASSAGFNEDFSGYTRYFTAVQSQIFINETQADEIFGVTYQASCGVTPYYGYASKRFDAVVRGKEEIQGQILVYYNQRKYFYGLIYSEDQTENAGSPSDDAVTTARVAAGDIAKDKSLSQDEKVSKIASVAATALSGGASKGTPTAVTQEVTTPSGVTGESSPTKQGVAGKTKLAPAKNGATPSVPTKAPTATVTTPSGQPVSPISQIKTAVSERALAVSGHRPPTPYEVQVVKSVAENAVGITNNPSIITSRGTQAVSMATERMVQEAKEAQEKSDAANKNKADAEEVARAVEEGIAADQAYNDRKKQEELAQQTEIEFAGPFRIHIYTGVKKRGDTGDAMKVLLKECFLTGKSRNYYQDDKILYTGYSFIARQEIDL